MAEITECIECAVCGSVGRLISENTEVSGGTLTYICPRCQPSYDCEVRPNGLSPWEYEARCVADFLSARVALRAMPARWNRMV
jgi:hypothetical protein